MCVAALLSGSKEQLQVVSLTSHASIKSHHHPVLIDCSTPVYKAQNYNFLPFDYNNKAMTFVVGNAQPRAVIFANQGKRKTFRLTCANFNYTRSSCMIAYENSGHTMSYFNKLSVFYNCMISLAFRRLKYPPESQRQLHAGVIVTFQSTEHIIRQVLSK